MGLRDSRLGWIVLACALTGLTGAFVMMHWMNGVDYPTVVGDKPAGGAADAAVDGAHPVRADDPLVGLRRGARDVRPEPPPAPQPPGLRVRALPRRQHDRFFISIEAEDPKFDVDEDARAARGRARGPCRSDRGGARRDRGVSRFRRARFALGAAALARRPRSLGCRGQTSDDPPIMPERNMYDTERYNPESYSQFFADHRTMRTPVEGTDRARSLRGRSRDRRRASSPTSRAT